MRKINPFVAAFLLGTVESTCSSKNGNSPIRMGSALQILLFNIPIPSMYGITNQM